MEPKKIKQEFFQKMRNEGSLELLFENLPGIYFWVKNENFQFVMCNQLVAYLCGCRNESEVLGKTDFDFFPRELCENFRKDDVAVLREKRPIRNRIEILSDKSGRVDWHVTNKQPMYSREGFVIGTAGTTRKLREENFLEKPYLEMSHIINYINENYMNQIDIKKLADMANLSISQFEIKFAKIFQMTPKKFIIKTRIKASCEGLTKSRAPLNLIALDYGFYDQSHYSNQFTALIGITPRQYRKKYFQEMKF